MINDSYAVTEEVFCTFGKYYLNNLLREVDSCSIECAVDKQEYVLGTPVDIDVKVFRIGNNQEVKYLPKFIGDKCPNLKKLEVFDANLRVVREFYCDDMQNLEELFLNHNKISVIEPGAFKHLFRTRKLHMDSNLIETFDEKLFTSMVELQELVLTNNRIRIFNPTTFKILGGKSLRVFLRRNACEDKDDGDPAELQLGNLEFFYTVNCTDGECNLKLKIGKSSL